MSNVWKIGLYKKKENDEVQCIECGKEGVNTTLKLSDSSTKLLRKHIEKHPEYKQKFDKMENGDQTPTITTFLDSGKMCKMKIFIA